MDPEEKNDASKEFGKVIDALHSKQKLPSLRTYQGDMAEFVKEKNESTMSIALKEKEKKEKELSLTPQVPNPKKSDGLRMNFIAIFLSILLLGGGLLASIYIFDYSKRELPPKTTIETDIIPYNNLLNLANVNNENFVTEINKIPAPAGINLIKISDNSGDVINKTKKFFDFLKISPPATLSRTLNEKYLVGIISQNDQRSVFVVFTVTNYGQAFSGMLGWEEKMPVDLSFLSQNNQVQAAQASTTIATSTATSTNSFKIPMKPEIFAWKDVIVKNKDTRALVNDKNKSQIVYTFLDKSTVLITRDLWAIGEISNIYTSRSFAR